MAVPIEQKQEMTLTVSLCGFVGREEGGDSHPKWAKAPLYLSSLFYLSCTSTRVRPLLPPIGAARGAHRSATFPETPPEAPTSPILIAQHRC
eukprot:scaffold81991_cov72-Phaeocystis_antarctica.AAC.1